MKKVFIIVLGMLIAVFAYSQTVQKQTWTEDFNGTVSFNAYPAGSWNYDTMYYLPGSSTIQQRAYLGSIPNHLGDTTILETQTYNCTPYTNVLLRFSHICKVSPQDIVRIEYRTGVGGGMGAWDSIPVTSYRGKAVNFRIKGFNAASYSEWEASDSSVFPSQSWWKEEIFDLNEDVSRAHVQFRFMIIHGNKPGTQASYGWLIDNFQLIAATHQLYPPIVEFIAPLRKDTVYGTGPWEINARVKTQTNVSIVRPLLIYTATYHGSVVKTDTLLMNNVKGDSLWKVSIPQYIGGTEVLYSIIGEDSLGNNAIAISRYVIQEVIDCAGTTSGGIANDYILQGNGTNATVYPFLHNWGYCRSMSLYPAADIDPNAVGLITSVALRVATAGTSPFPMQLYLKTVPVSKIAWDATDNLSWADLTQDATLVYDGLFQFAQTGWVDVPLTTYFPYLRTDNLVLMCVQNCGGTSCPGYAEYYCSASSTATPNMLMSKYADNTPPDAAGGNVEIYYARPDLRISVVPLCADSNAASVHSIDLNDTTVISSPTFPVVVTIKNKGSENLTSATVYYSVNGIIQQPYPLTGVNLPWDFNTQVTIGNYSPKMNGYDTIVVWVKMPNGEVDNNNSDDTLTKIIYGSPDIVIALVDQPNDTVYDTGPFEIKISIHKLSGDPIVPPVNLVVSTTFEGGTTTDPLSMALDPADNLWKVSIAQKQYKSDVVYFISLTDKYGNVVTMTDSFYVKRFSQIEDPYVIVGTGSVTNYQTPMNMYYNYSWTRQLYLGSEIGGGLITKLAWEWASTHTSSWGNYTNQTCYFRIVDDVSVTSTVWEDPVAAGATQVWTGQFAVPTAPGWVEFILDQPFYLPSGKNLLIYWHHRHGGYPGSAYLWNHTTMSQNMAVQACSDGSFPSSSTGTSTTARPNARFFLKGKTDVDTSVALVDIESPLSSEVIGGSVPIRVKISNYGMDNLNSCIVNWSVNGGIPMSRTWTGDLPEDFTDTITLDDYFPVLDQRDTIIVWVSMPNGGTDTITKDDTSMVTTFGCAGIVSGVKSIPGDFATINAAVSSIIDCGISGKTILEIASCSDTGIIDLSALKGILTTRDTLVIRSATGNASDVIFTAASGTPALRMNGIRNLYVEHITLNAASGTHGVEIIGQCDNVEINSCVINANTSTTSSSGGCGVYYYGGSSGPAMGNIRLLNNTITHGYSGIYLYYLNPTAAVQSASTSWVRINGNTIENSYHSGIYSYYYARYDSIAYNTINTRASATAQYGMYLYYYNRVNGGVIGNKINMRGTSTAYGIYPYYMNYSSTGATFPALIANNEIRRLSSGGTFYGLTHYYNRADYIHNSVYGEGTSSNYAMYISYSSATYSGLIMNNLFISKGTSTSNYAVYASSASYVTPAGGMTMDYNDYFSTGTNLCYNGTAVATLAAWQTATQQDANSVNIDPDFLNINNSLEIVNNTGITTPRLASVDTDITGRSRINPTVIGAYDLLPTSHDLMLLQLTSWNSDVVKGQTVRVSVDAQNLGVPITGATFGWSLNGIEQFPSISWTASPVFASFTQRTIPIGSFIATGVDMFNVVVWVKTINGQQDTAQWNDTVTAWSQIAPLAEFVAPFVGDTLGSLSFDVNVKIREGSGGAVNTPQMYIETLMDGNGSCYIHTYDTVPMIQDGDKWVANIPKQYYGSRVIYETYISDAIGNNVTLRDTTYIMFGSIGNIDEVTDLLYTGSVQTLNIPAGTYKIECWGGQGGSSNGGGAASGISKIGGKGGYSVGEITLRTPTIAYIYVGGEGLPQAILASGGFNGGGNSAFGSVIACGGGGGASDVRIGSDSLYSRVIVAGGGGAAGFQECNGNAGVISGGHGGGATGGTPIAGSYAARIGQGGTQMAGGSGGTETYGNGNSGSFGLGGDGAIMGTNGNGGGGGGGWYGGGAGANGSNCAGGGGGGSGYVYTSATAGNYPLGCLLNNSHYLANAQAIGGDQSFLSPAGVSETGHTGDGFVRITVISGGGGEVYDIGNNLGIFNLVSPANNDDKLCIDISSPVEIELVNLGKNDYDFTQDNITIGYEIINPRGIIYNGNLSIDTGDLFSGEAKSIELIPSIPIIAGSYTIKTWVTSAIDDFSCDDTLNYIYTSSLIQLPIDEDFSGTFDKFVSIPIVGQEIWTPYIDINYQILPPTGHGRIIQYAGSFGTMAQLSTRQLDLSGVIDPELKFWYYHDATTPDLDKSYTEVNILVDNVSTTVLTLSRGGATTGWQQYTIDLRPFTKGQCVLIQFESMNRYNTLSAQYIGHVTITSTPDLEVSEIIISPEVTVCDMTNKELKVVLSTVVNQAISFTQEDSLRIQIGSQPPFTHPLTGTIAGNRSETISVATNVDLTGVTNIKAYLSTPVDNNSSNDTAQLAIVMNPEMTVTVHPSSGGSTNCLRYGFPVYQDITLANIGNVDLTDIKLILRITFGNNNTETIKEIDPIPSIKRDSVLGYRFTVPYFVPEENYLVQVIAYSDCDSARINTIGGVNECVDKEDLYIVSIDSSFIGKDSVDTEIHTIVTLRNLSDITTFSSLNVTVMVENSQRIETERITETTAIGTLSTISHTFANAYTVPYDTVYYLTVYIDSYDNYSDNDTLTIKRTIKVEDKDLSLSITNPTSEKDVVGRSVQVSANLYNSNKHEDFAGTNITVLVENSQKVQMDKFAETTAAIGKLSTVNHSFSKLYTVPDDSVYYLTVYIESHDNYPSNDTMKLKRYTESVGIKMLGTTNVFTLSQNIPNPANNSTLINYSVPEAGKVVFHVHSISGQLLYSKTIETERGTNSIELNTSTFAAGVYFYSMEYKGQRLVRQLIINN
jgi:hypothetical protein